MSKPTEAQVKEAEEFADRTLDCICNPNHPDYGQKCWFHLKYREQCEEVYLAALQGESVRKLLKELEALRKVKMAAENCLPNINAETFFGAQKLRKAVDEAQKASQK